MDDHFRPLVDSPNVVVAIKQGGRHGKDEFTDMNIDEDDTIPDDRTEEEKKKGTM